MYSQLHQAYLDATYAEIDGVWHPAHLDGVDLDLTLIEPHEVYSLEIDGKTWMCTTAIDLLDHRTIRDDAHGDILLTGLGMGLGVILADRNPAVRSVTVVERDQRVIDLIWPMVQPHVTRVPVELVVADANTWEMPRQYDWAYIDHEHDWPSAETLDRYRSALPQVKVWREETERVRRAWR